MDSPVSLVQSLRHFAPQPAAWLWPRRLARGKISVFDGDPEMGKSLVTLDLAARITTGRLFPDGAAAIEPANVIILNAEDATEDTVLPRLQALGADPARVFCLHADFPQRAGPFRLPAQTDFLDLALEETHAAFVVLDPIMAFFDASVQTASDMSVRTALSPLAEIAANHGCHITLVRHLNKRGRFQAMYRGGGSIGILAACRSAYLFAAEPNDTGRRILAEIKNNLAPRQPSLSYSLASNEAGQPTIQWLGESPLAANQLLASAGVRPPLPRARDRALDFLHAFLADGPRSTLDIWDAAREMDISRRTLQRLLEKGQVNSTTRWNGTRTLTYWFFPGQKPPIQEESNRPSLEPWIAPLREQYPPDPLDPDTAD